MRHETSRSGGMPGSRSFIAFVALLLVVIESSATESVELVRDINPGSSSGGAVHITDVNGTLFFSARVNTGSELWKSDGTADGTVQVLEICGGLQSGIPAAAEFIDLNGTLYFAATDCDNGVELWRSDGTPEGTVMAADIDPDNPDGSGGPTNLTVVGNALFFSADDGVNGRELWKYDPVTEVAAMVMDIHPGSSSNPSELTNVNGTLFFAATTGGTSIGGTGNELWKHDPATNTTVLVRDIHPNGTSNSSNPHNLTNVGGVLFFAASHESDPGTNNELWKSDGTELGTIRVKDILPGNASSSPNHLTDVNGTLFFAARNTLNNLELWKSDGTEAGTVQVDDIFPGDGGSGPNHLTDVNGTLFFVATYVDGDGSIDRELWKSDGTADGTVLVKDLIANLSSDPEVLFNFNGTLFFAATRSTFLGLEGTELWKSDGTADGTVLVEDIHPTGSSNPGPFAVSNGVLFFDASDATFGNELRKLVTTSVGEICNNGTDDDGDGDVDGEDSDCNEICDNGVDDDGDGDVDENDSDCKRVLVRCHHEPIYSTDPNQVFTVKAQAVDPNGEKLEADSIEIFLDFDRSQPQALVNDSSSASVEHAPGGSFSYYCRAKNGPSTHVSLWRMVVLEDIPFAAIPVVLNKGKLSEKVDIVFFPDDDEYTSYADPAFIEDVGLLIAEGFGTMPSFLEKQHMFNFWIGMDSGNASPRPSNERCFRQAPDNFRREYPFADSAGIVHRSECRDNAGSPGLFTIEMNLDRLQVVIHETGHRPFGLADEYCCDGGYFTNSILDTPPFANLFRTENGCRNDAEDRGFGSDACRELFASGANWWLFEPDYDDLTPEPWDWMQQQGCAAYANFAACSLPLAPATTGPDSDPNGLYACNEVMDAYRVDTSGGTVCAWDPDDGMPCLWLCRTPGTAGEAVWVPSRGFLDRYEVGPSELDRFHWFLGECSGGKC